MTPADTSFQVIVLWVAALGSLLSFGTAIWTIFSGPSRKNATRLDGMATKIDALTLRIGTVETAQTALPTKQDMHELELAMERLKGEMATMSQGMSGHAQIMLRVEAIVARHEEHLLKGNRS